MKKQLSKGDQLAKEYHNKPVEQKMREANPLMDKLPDGITRWTTGMTSVMPAYNLTCHSNVIKRMPE